MIQHLSYLYVYMLHPNAKELTLVQVNRSQLLPYPEICEDLLSGVIVRSSIDLPSPADVSLSMVICSLGATDVRELDVSYKYDSTILRYAEMSAQEVMES